MIFNATSMGQVLSDLGGMFGAGAIPLVSAEALYYLKSYALIFVIAVIGATPLPKRLAEKGSCVLSYVELPFLAALLIVCTAYLVDGSFNPFLYFRF